MNNAAWFLIVLLVVQKFVDWIFQSKWTSENKTGFASKLFFKERDFSPLATTLSLLHHSMAFASITSLITFLIVGMIPTKGGFLIPVLLFVSHAIIDTYIPTVLIMRLKGMPKMSIKKITNKHLVVGIDQRLHEISALLITIIVYWK